MIIGQNKQAIKQVKKNLLPPFDDKGWIIGTGVEDVQAEGYNISFKTSKYQASVYYNIPHDLVAGKSLTISVIDRSPAPTKIQLNIYNGSSWSYFGADVSNYFTASVPANAQIVQFRIQNQSNTAQETYHFISNIQAEIGTTPTAFEEKYDTNNLIKINTLGKNIASNKKEDWSIRGLTNWFKLEDNVLTYEAKGQYGGANLVNFNKYVDLRGKTVTMSYKEATPFNNLMFYYVNSSGVGVYIATDSTKSRTISVPIDSTDHRLYIQNVDTGASSTNLKTYMISDIQLEIGDKVTEFEEYKPVSKKAKVVPRKNLFPTNSFTVTPSVSDMLGNQRASVLVKNFPVKPNTTYTISAKYASSYKSLVVLIGTKFSGDDKYTHNSIYTDLVSSGGGRQLSSNLTFTTTANEKSVTITTGNASAGTFPSKILYEEVQLEEGSIATPFSPYIESNKLSKNSFVKKIAVKNYPFSFTRESMNSIGSELFAKNQPRITKEGIVMENETTNLWKNRNVLTNNGTTVQDLGDRLKYTATVSGSNSTGGYINNNPVRSGTDYTVSFRMNGDSSVTDKVRITVEKSSGNIYPKPVKNGDRYYVSFNTGSGVTNVVICFYLTNTVTGESFELYKDYQLEEKKYPTTYVSDKRSKELLAIQNAGQYIDTERGSIEMELVPLTGDNIDVGGGAFGFHDLVTYIAGVGGFIIRRGYSAPNRVELITVSSVSGINLFGSKDTIGWKSGTLLKYRLEWDRTKDTTKVIVNDIHLIEVPNCFKMFDSNYVYSMTVGSRGIIADGYGCGNAIYKSLIIRNRNGETTFRL